jgi:UDP-GlcNAc:undecaprenyl-phosphate GlcNAc-1-phosphate transferase
MNYILVSISSVLALYFIYFFSKKYDFLDYPDAFRKEHAYPTPYTGGVAIFISFLIIFKLNNFDNLINKIIIYSGLIVILGLIDDKYRLNVIIRVIFQITIISFPIIEGLIISNLGNIENFGIINLGSFSTIFTIISVAILMNGFNYIDGKDGLASSLFLNTTFLLILFLFISNNQINEILFFSFINVLVFFLFNLRFFNLPKLFLGDNGSLLLGYFLSFILIYLSQNMKFIEPSLVIWSITFLIFEFFSTNFSRVIKKNNPFKAGKDHIHFFLNKKYGLIKTLLLINLFNILLAIIGYVIWKNLNNKSALISFVIFFIIYFFIRDRLMKKNILT